MTWAYVAGFTDGDGSILWWVDKKERIHFQITWGQVDKTSDVIHALETFLNVNGIVCQSRIAKQSRKAYGTREMRVLAVNRREDILKILKRITPHLILKRAGALEVIEAIEARVFSVV
jgi:hypothetical protein